MSPFHSLSDDFGMDSHDFDIDTSRNKANAKESLHKNLEHCHHTGANPSVIDTMENDWNISVFTCYSHFNNFVLSNNQPALQNEDFITHTAKKLLKSRRIKKIRTPFCFVKSFYYRQKEYCICDTQFFLFITSE